MFPQAWDYSIGSGNRRNRRNATELHNQLVAFMRQFKNKDSLFHQMIEDEGVSFADVMNDLKGTLMAGFDTSARCATTTVYRLLKNPEKMKKLKETLKQRLHVLAVLCKGRVALGPTDYRFHRLQD